MLKALVSIPNIPKTFFFFFLVPVSLLGGYSPFSMVSPASVYVECSEYQLSPLVRSATLPFQAGIGNELTAIWSRLKHTSWLNWTILKTRKQNSKKQTNKRKKKNYNKNSSVGRTRELCWACPGGYLGLRCHYTYSVVYHGSPEQAS